MARDGHAFQAYIAGPAGHARGGLIIIQEIFGLSPHIRGVANSYAADGYMVIAPALFDRVRRDLVLGDSPEEVERGRGYRKQIPENKSVLDIAACVAVARHCGKVGVIGYCWGGLLAWVAAGEIHLDGAVCYYGGGIVNHLERTPACATMLHFGERDTSIPLTDVEHIRAAYPQGQYSIYAAGHGFNNDTRANHYDAAAAALARTRTQTFLTQHIG
jgi:carboxymethylenebutenolidase